MSELLKWIKENEKRSGGDIFDLLKLEKGIKVKEYPDADYSLYVLNYCQIESPKTDPVVMECRGIILDQHYNILCRPFKRFFNYGEALEITSTFDINHASVYEKADGSLIKMWYNPYSDQWCIGTRGTAFAESENYTGKSFIGMVEEVIGTKWQEAVWLALDRTCTYLFEFISPENRIVTPYKTTSMIYLGHVNNATGEEAFCPYVVERLGFQNTRPAKTYNFSSMEGMLEVVRELKDLEEGFVAHDLRNNIKVKLKSPTYVAVHKIRGESCLTPKRIKALVVEEEQDEYLTYFPEDIPQFDPYIQKHKLFLKEMRVKFEEVKGIQEQKDYALAVKDLPYCGILFTSRKNNISVSSAYKDLDNRQRMKVFSSWLGDNDA